MNPYDAPREIPLVLAPMAELTHAAFRTLVADLGGCDVFFTEMLSARSVARSTQPSLFLRHAPEETDLVHQLAGADPDLVAEAAAVLDGRGVRRIDLNMGCSAPMMTGKGEGAALLSDPARAEAMVRAVRRRFPGHLSVKMRLPEPGGVSAVEFALRIEGAGAQTLAFHPRFPSEKFRRRARWECIRQLREKVSVPVVGNGDIAAAADIHRMLEQTGCSGIMVGRGAAIRPWIFAQAAGLRQSPPDPRRVLEDFISRLELHLPAERHLSRLKIFIHWFCRSLDFGHSLFSAVQPAPTLERAWAGIEAFFRAIGQQSPP